ncbi:phospholipase D-like domain-containing protein [Cryobacterium sp. GrIS_2_6]|uniref:phospholipase D-like domain-containing protein n=1 Tax=Cryobacterium sp. GrIS_2_6 TaxID=3162785 RepID=UPI002E08D4E5|nr:phosphatidylserine/phosphatidylglycerophosphate/cardiolipin synthase-like enzyme [Cryobacterium psychrotolerans]MEC5149246.1 phosphatidylserine/phosphatidylglycerophosphate/cardiolipin synthase-like enzyme [Cryobacterium psychrotolerans]MEC5149324.1 phosphatidylserine/phosphatidylglycerophosphate/cardiolipin synthase-like enzyme [Cryobacterium psychrotolerans]
MALLTIADLDQFKASPVDPTYPADTRTFYSPIDDVHGALKAVIASAQHSLIISMFGWDDDELAEIIAHIIDNPAIFVQITLDKSQAGGVHEKALLTKFKHEMDSNSVAIGTSEHGAIVHRKMVIIDGVWRIGGSTNWSASGETLQDNEMTVHRNAVICAEARPVLDISHNKALKDMAKRLAVRV